jgi:uncharacterized protein (TIGR03437 family)
MAFRWLKAREVALRGLSIFFAGSGCILALTLPVRFERNAGQAPPRARFIAHVPGYALWMGNTSLSIQSSDGQVAPLARFTGASEYALMDAREPMPGRANYYRGDPGKWVSGVPFWSRVRYRNLYPGIQVDFYGRGTALEYDVLVSAGADPSRLGFDFDPSTTPRVDGAGDLVIGTVAGDVIWRKPSAFQDGNGVRKPVAATFWLRGHHLSFHVGSWDRGLPLVIDPAVSFATYLGGSGDDGARAVAVDGAQNVYLAGGTGSGNLPVTASSYQHDFRGTGDGGPGDAFIAKLDSSGSKIIFITYLGGSSADLATSIAVDNAGNSVVAGSTSSTDFPTTTGAFQTKYAGAGGDNNLNPSAAFWPGSGDAFVARFDPSGKLLWSTYLGGSKSDGASAVALDASGNVIVTGSTLSSNFPVKVGKYNGSGGQPTVNDTGYVSFDTGDVFVVRLDANGTRLMNGNYFGGSADDTALAVLVAPSGEVWVGGGTLSTDLPVTPKAMQSKFSGASDNNTQLIAKMGDGFIVEFGSDLTQYHYCSYLGGSRDDAITSIAMDNNGYLYLGGVTQSADFPVTAGAYSTKYHGPSTPPAERPYLLGDGFVVKFNPNVSTPLYSTYLGGSDDDAVAGIAVDSQGNVAVAGMTNSHDFPVSAGAQQASLAGSGNAFYAGIGDAFIAQLNSSGSSLLYSSYLGGSADDAAFGVGSDPAGNFYVAGYTNSGDFPTTAGVIQPRMAAGKDTFVVKVSGLLGAAATPAVAAVTNAASFVAGSVVPGSMATLFGTNLTSAAGINLTSTLPLPTTFENVSVKVNGVPAPLFAVDNVNGQQQINFQTPWEVSGAKASITVTNGGATSAALQAPVAAAQPGIFSYSQGGKTYGAILHANYQLASTSHPAVAGETVLIYMTGLGATPGHPATGAPAVTGASTSTLASVTIGGKNAHVDYSGLAPAFVGLYQVNAIIPSGLSSGDQPVVVTLGTASNTVLLPIQ